MTEERREILDKFKKLITNNVGALSLLLQLVTEINKNAYISLMQNDPTRKMLLEWSKLPEMKIFMEKCFSFGQG